MPLPIPSLFCKIEVTELGTARGVTIIADKSYVISNGLFIPFQDMDATTEQLKTVYGQSSPFQDIWALQHLVNEKVKEQGKTTDKAIADILDVLSKHNLLPTGVVMG